MARHTTISPVELTPGDVAALDPSVLAPFAADAVDSLLAEGESENTVRSYQTALRYWAAWFWLRYRQPIALPVPVAAIQQFIVDHVERRTKSGLEAALPAALDQALVDGGFKGKLGTPALSTVLHRLSVLSKAHQVRGVANMAQDNKVRDLVAKTRRAYAKRGVMPDKKAALTLEPLQAMLTTCDDSLRGVRDRALLLFAWSSGGRRRSEVTDATMENTRRVGPRAFSFTLLHSKTNQTGALRADSEKPILEEAADALAAWIRRAGLTEGPIFRRVRRGEKVGEPLAPAAVRGIVLERAALAGLEPEFAAHSLRSGFVTEAARQNVPLGEAMALTGHSSPTSLIGYFRAAESSRSAGATLLRASRVSPAQSIGGEELPTSNTEV
jgi:integrase